MSQSGGVQLRFIVEKAERHHTLCALTGLPPGTVASALPATVSNNMPSAGAAGASAGQLPAHMQVQRDNVICGPDLNYHVRQTSIKPAADTCAASCY